MKEIVILSICFVLLTVLVLLFNKWTPFIRKSKERVKDYYEKHDQEDEDNTNVMRKPFYYLFLGSFFMFISALFTAVVFLIPDRLISDPDPLARLPILFMTVPFFMTGLVFVLLRLNWQVEVFSDRFYYRNLFRRTKEYRFFEVEQKFGRVFHFEKYYIGKRRVLTITYDERNVNSMVFAYGSWKSQQKKQGDQSGEGGKKRIPEKIFRMLKESGLDLLEPQLRQKVLDCESADDGEPINRFFTPDEFIRIFEKLNWMYFFVYDDKLILLSHQDERGVRPYSFTVDLGLDEDNPYEEYETAAELMDNTSFEGRSIRSLWDEMKLPTE